MAEICVVYLSEDEVIAERLVLLLRKYWDVWWARDIAHGDWEKAVRTEIGKSRIVVPLLSQCAKGERMTILKDEMRYAREQEKPILPLLIGPAEVPFGFGDLHHTNAPGWAGKEAHPGYQELKAKIVATIGSVRGTPFALPRPRELLVRGKTLRLPAFVFSLSSHETQVEPHEGAALLHAFEPNSVLVSAYDAWKSYRHNSAFRSAMHNLHESKSVLFLDSGNYESYRKNDRYAPKRNPTGWQKNLFQQTAAWLSPDLAFSFDTIEPKGEPERIAAKIAAAFRADDRALRERDFELCPIVHLPKECDGTIADCAALIVAGVAAELEPFMLAIPERELGAGLIERVRTVRDIRKALNAFGRYYPLHLLGTGNPLSMIALAAAGADSFDGLEWCRTVADYDSGFLFHFHQFDCFCQARLNRIKDQRIRHLIEDPSISYSVRTLSYNVDFFKDSTRTMQNMIHSGQTETLLNLVPNIGSTLFKELSK